jgi:D-alanine-D-alanine ligase
MEKRLRVGLLFGGRSAEHEVSLASARNIARAIDRSRYDVLLICIDKEGRWGLIDDPAFFDSFPPGTTPELTGVGEALSVSPCHSKGEFLFNQNGKCVGSIDVIFPVLHGTFGEDGTLQGLLALSQMPFVGSGVLASAAAMDKDVMKRLLRDARIPLPRFAAFGFREKSSIEFRAVRSVLGLPLFVKPANLGSSVGIHKAKNEKEFKSAVEDAFVYDSKIVIEEFIEGREIECSVLGNEDPAASLPGEVIPKHEFYSYEAKYVDEEGALLKIPAEISESETSMVQELAVKSFRTLCCEGMARVDFFLRADGQVLVNELNTLPGFTNISMYPKLWEASGLSQTALIDRLIQLAIERSQREQRLRRTYV